MEVKFEIPDDLAPMFADSGQALSRAALEAIGLEAYRQGRISGYQLRTMLGISSRYELDGFLKQHQVYDYTMEDFEKDFATISSSRGLPKVDKSA
jgi:hypothetical protein